MYIGTLGNIRASISAFYVSKEAIALVHLKIMLEVNTLFIVFYPDPSWQSLLTQNTWSLEYYLVTLFLFFLFLLKSHDVWFSSKTKLSFGSRIIRITYSLSSIRLKLYSFGGCCKAVYNQCQG